MMQTVNPARILGAAMGLLALAPLVPSADLIVGTGGRGAPALFGDGMVLQRDLPIPVWGTAKPGARVSVSFRGKTASATAGPDGAWRADLPAQAAGGPFTLAVSGGESVTFSDVWVGEVWLCSGQSNMEIGTVPAADLAAHPGVRGLVEAKWGEKPCPTAFWFGVKLNEELGVPVGLINRAVGSSSIRSWLGPRVKDDADQIVTDIYAGTRDVGKCYERKIVMLYPYAIRGIAWWQGEDDRDFPEEHAHLLPALIRSFRGDWGREDLPFIFVQLPNSGGIPHGEAPAALPASATIASPRAVMRQSFVKSLETPYTAMITSLDTEGGLHPPNHDEYGRRLGLAALATVYGKDVVYAGPTIESSAIEGNRVRIRFRKNTATGLSTSAGEPLQGFAASADGKTFEWAEAKIEGEEVVVQCAKVPRPKIVRYGWDDNPRFANLFNEAGFGASPFSTEANPGPYGGAAANP